MTVFDIDTALHVLRFVGESLIILGVVLTVVMLALFIRGRRDLGARRKSFSVALVVLVSLIIMGSSFFFLNGSAPSRIIIGNSQVTVSGQFIGNQTYSSSQIKYAFVENINSGNITLSNRNMGTSLGNINEGRYTLSNGASADVVTNNATVLVVELSTGTYLVLGCDNTLAMAQDFANSVHPVSGL